MDNNTSKDIFNNEENSIIVLTSQEGEDIPFIEIAGIALDGSFYAILQPVELFEGMAEDDALVFKVTTNDDNSNNFSVEVDDDIVDRVFEAYYKLLDEANEKE